MIDDKDIVRIAEEAAKTIMTKSIDIIAENDFVREVLVKDIREPLDILNWYRNLYYKENMTTERGLMAVTINDLFMKYNFTLR